MILLRIASAITLLPLMCAPVHAQWVKVPRPAIPRTADGKPNLSAPAPRLPDGHPDLGGIWSVDNKYVRDLATDLLPGAVPYQPWAKALFDERKVLRKAQVRVDAILRAADRPEQQQAPRGLRVRDRERHCGAAAHAAAHDVRALDAEVLEQTESLAHVVRPGQMLDPSTWTHAYSAAMKAYLSLTAAPSRSTPLLFSGTRFPFPARG